MSTTQLVAISNLTSILHLIIWAHSTQWMTKENVNTTKCQQKLIKIWCFHPMPMNSLWNSKPPTDSHMSLSYQNDYPKFIPQYNPFWMLAPNLFSITTKKSHPNWCEYQLDWWSNPPHSHRKLLPPQFVALHLLSFITSAFSLASHHPLPSSRRCGTEPPVSTWLLPNALQLLQCLHLSCMPA